MQIKIDEFDIKRDILFNLFSDPFLKDNGILTKENINWTNSYLDEKIKECRNEKNQWPESLDYFDLLEGETYYLLSGFNHPLFKVVSKSPSGFNNKMPYYEIKYVKTNCVMDNIPYVFDFIFCKIY